MSFSSDNSQIINQSQLTINLPSLSNSKLFESVLTDILRSISNSLNSKEGGLYTLEEKGNSEQYYIQGNPQKFRNVYRKVFDFINLNGGNIGSSASINFAHNINSIFQSAGIYANCKSNDGRIFTVVYPDVWADSTNVYFVNPIAVELTQCDVVLNYLKN